MAPGPGQRGADHDVGHAEGVAHQVLPVAQDRLQGTSAVLRKRSRASVTTEAFRSASGFLASAERTMSGGSISVIEKSTHW